jgi:hypothetical protein
MSDDEYLYLAEFRDIDPLQAQQMLTKWFDGKV